MRIHEAARYTVERFGLPEDPQDLEREWMDMARREYAHNVQTRSCRSLLRTNDKLKRVT